MPELKAIDTYFRGYKFRSRLEARWAVFLTHLAVPFDYEFQGFDLGAAGWYLPDFWLPQQQVWIEVKPTQEVTTDELKKARALAQQSSCAVYVVIGLPGSDPAIYMPTGKVGRGQTLLQNRLFKHINRRVYMEAMLKAKQARFEKGA